MRPLQFKRDGRDRLAIVAGYVGQPAESSRNFRNGWFITNDLGRMDAQGRLYLLGRRDDMLSISGRKLSPFPIEEQIRAGLGGLDVICVDHTDPESLLTCLCVAVQVPAGADREALRRRVERIRLTFPTPIRHCFVERFPMTAAGKPDRRAIRRLFG